MKSLVALLMLSSGTFAAAIRDKRQGPIINITSTTTSASLTCTDGQACPTGYSCAQAQGICVLDSTPPSTIRTAPMTLTTFPGALSCIGGPPCESGTYCNQQTGLCTPMASASSSSLSPNLSCANGQTCPNGFSCISSSGICVADSTPPPSVSTVAPTSSQPFSVPGPTIVPNSLGVATPIKTFFGTSLVIGAGLVLLL